MECVSFFLEQLLGEHARYLGPEYKCMERALEVLDRRWHFEDEEKWRAMFATEDVRMIGAVLMGGVYLPLGTFAAVAGYLDHKSAMRSMRCAKAWWRTSEFLRGHF